MKKAVMMLCMVMSLFITNVFAQEVRGIETRRVIYYGPEYYNMGAHTEYYGWEFTNRNSFPVSVDISLWVIAQSNGNTTIPAGKVKTQSIILEPKEKYVFKREEHCSTMVYGRCDYPISSYYIEYKAYKLQ